MYVCMYVCYVCMYVCMYVCIYVCLVCVCVYVCVRVCTEEKSWFYIGKPLRMKQFAYSYLQNYAGVDYTSMEGIQLNTLFTGFFWSARSI
jgi:hypothetical protein